MWNDDFTESYDDVTVIINTGKALLCEIDGDKYWVPHSVIIDEEGTIDSKSGRSDTGTLAIKQWFAEKMESVVEGEN